MSTIIRKENSTHNTLSIYHIALTVVGYISFYNALIDLHEISGEIKKRKGKNLQNFLHFANTAVLKDFSILVNELYVYLEELNPGQLQKHNNTEPRFDEFLKFIKKTKNNMKFHPSQKKINNILLTQKDRYPDIWGKLNNDLLYWCGYFMGDNVVFGSNWYLEYMFYEPKKICKNDGDLLLFTNSIQTHLKTFFRVFEEVLFKDGIDIPKIKFKEQKRFFQIFPQTMSSKKMFQKSRYDKTTTFMLMLILEEISSMQVYYDYYFDVEESSNSSSLLLFFFTYILSIKYDEIRDCFDNLITNYDKLGVDPNLMIEFSKLNVFKKEITDFAYKLRNSYHHTEIAKYTVHQDDGEEKININMEDLYLKLTNSTVWPDDYKKMLKCMKEELNIVLQFCRKSIGIRY